MSGNKLATVDLGWDWGGGGGGGTYHTMCVLVYTCNRKGTESIFVSVIFSS